MSKSAAAAIVDGLPQTPTAPPSSSLHSTPSTTLSPGGLTPTTSPHPAKLAAILARASSSLQLSPQTVSPVSGGGYPSPTNSMVSASSTPLAMPGVSSPQGSVHAGGKHVLPIAAKQPVPSPVSAAKAVLHQRCPANQPGCASPLTKASIASTELAAAQSNPLQRSPSSLVTSKSPMASAKFVTVSILQQLQQNPNFSKLLAAANTHQSNGNA